MTPPSTREEIVAAARRLFYERGFQTTSLGEVARAASVPKGNFYYHFQTKDDLLRAVLSARRADIERALERWAADLPMPLDRLRRFVRMVTSERERLTQYGCPTGSMLTELGKKHEALLADARAILDLYVQFATRAFADLGHDATRATILGARLMGRAQGAILLAHAYADPTLLDREIEDIERWIESEAEGSAGP